MMDEMEKLQIRECQATASQSLPCASPYWKFTFYMWKTCRVKFCKDLFPKVFVQLKTLLGPTLYYIVSPLKIYNTNYIKFCPLLAKKNQRNVNFKELKSTQENIVQFRRPYGVLGSAKTG